MPSRNEQYLEAAVNKSGTDGLPEPRTRNEKLLHRLVEEVSSGEIQSDLNVNDETNPAYVKNRTHWAEESMIDIFPEQTLEFINNNDVYGVEIPIDLFSFGITEGDQLTVILDGVEYECILQFFEPAGFLYIGNLAITIPDEPSSVNGEPFVIGFIQNEDVKGAFIATELSGSTHTLQIRALTETVHKLDSKYIPDGIVEHINDSAIHVTSDDKTKWDSHTSDNGIHVTSEDKTGWNDSLKLYSVNAELPSISSSWSGLVYGDGKFIATSSSYQVARSSDGITWTEYSMGIGSGEWLITYGNDKFVCIESSRSTKAGYSSDGITWTKTTMPSSDRLWQDVCYGNGKFVAVSTNDSSISAYSSDGITWTQTAMPSAANWYSVTYGNGKFVAVSRSSSTAAYSIDGITWTETTIPFADYMTVAYGNGKFVAAGGSISAYSNDGVTWIENALPFSGSIIVYGNNKFLLTPFSITNTAAYSSDGITWTKCKMLSSGIWSQIAYGNDRFVAMDINGGKVACSIDGITWKNTFSRLQTVSGTDITEQVKEALQFV